MMIRFLLTILFVSFVFYSCTEKIKNTNTQTTIDSAKINDSLLVALDTLPKIPIFSYKLIKTKSYQALISDYYALGVNIILALNRIDKNGVRSLDSIVVPDTIINNSNIYSPFPQRIDILEKVKKILIVSQTHQAFAIYEFGSLVKWGSTSTGKKSTLTPNGLFATNWKSKKTTSTVNDEWILKWYFNLDNFEGVSLHEYELPGYPASHSCARLFFDDAF